MSPDEQPWPAPPAASRRAWGEWIGKAVFEAVLIVLGLVGALLIDEWRDDRERRVRLDIAMASIRTELTNNLAALSRIVEREEMLMVELRKLQAAGKRYEGPVLTDAASGLGSIAWEAARDAGVMADVPFERLTAFGRAYGSLAAYRAEIAFFSQQLYSNSVPQYRSEPITLAFRFNDLVSRARGVRANVGEALGVIP
jgi:hypothetical protein